MDRAGIPAEFKEEQFGAYQALRKVGEGASSVVFEAIHQGDNFAQKVALKLLLEADGGALGSAETRVLARLDHPKIARLLDAGSTRRGMRFLVTEFVDGIPCTEYVVREKLPVPAILRLFLDVCEAVHYANSSLVLHCDIKPANVLVKQDGTVKLLDFGISRLLTEKAGEIPTGSRYYTPPYASPEQMAGKALGVATDVYALGALLTELLTGRNPEVNSSLPAGFPDDLGVIIQKAMRYEAGERYATVAELAADVQRFLEGRPILARPVSLGERLWKFAARHRTASALGALALLLLVAGTAYALQQRARAEARFAEIRSLANAVLFPIYDDLAKLPGSLAARLVLTETGVRYLDALAASSANDRDLQLEAARGVLRLADIEGVGNEPNIGRTAQAQQRLERSEKIVNALEAAHPAHSEVVRTHALIQEALAIAYSLQGDAKAVPMARQYLASTLRLRQMQPNDEQNREEYAHALHTVANTVTQSKTDNSDAAKAWEETIREWETLYREQPKSVVRKRELARAHQFYAGALVREVRREEARVEARKAYQMHKELAASDPEGEEHMLSADVGLLANINAQLKRYDEAIVMFQEQLQLRQRVVARDPGNLNAQMGVAGTMDRIGYALVRMGKPAEGVPWLEKSLTQQREIHKKTPENVLVNREMLFVLSDLAEANELLRRRGAMCALAREGKAILAGPISKTRETPIDAAKKKILRGYLQTCGG